MKYMVPKKGVFIRDPETRQPLPPEGKQLAVSTFWNRRARDGDVKMYDSPPPKDTH